MAIIKNLELKVLKTKPIIKLDSFIILKKDRFFKILVLKLTQNLECCTK